MGCDNNVRPVDAAHPSAAVIAEAARIIAGGGVVAFPTAALYGLAADAFTVPAVEKIRSLKKRPSHKPILLLVRGQAEAAALVATIPAAARRIMDHCWPGLVTLVMKARSDLPAHLVAADGSIGLRVPAHPVARALVAACASPRTGTSANLSGQPGIYRADQINRRLTGPPDLILDAGRLPGGAGSTVIDVRPWPPCILRAGSFPPEELSRLLDESPVPGRPDKEC
ncbi:MAG: L-threonylcarbamoyladenylate synthase [Desulfosudaceae bacterium]